MNKFNEQKQIEETTEFQESEAMQEANEDKYLSEYTRAFKNESDGWICTIDENLDQSEYPKFVATFEDQFTAEVHVRRCGTIKVAGKFLVDCLESHYQRHAKRYTTPATEQLNAEDEIDGFTQPY